MISDPLLRVRGDLELLFLSIGPWLLSVSSCRMEGSEDQCKIDDETANHMVLETYWWACIVGMRVVDDHHMSKRRVVGIYQLASRCAHETNLPDYSPTAGTKVPEETRPIYCRAHD